MSLSYLPIALVGLYTVSLTSIEVAIANEPYKDIAQIVQPQALETKETELTEVTEGGIRLEISSSILGTGAIATLNLNTPSSETPPKIEGSFEGQIFPFFPQEKCEQGFCYAALMGIPFTHRKGVYKIQVDVTLNNSKKTLLLPIKIIERTDEEDVEMLDLKEEHVRPAASGTVEKVLNEENEVDAIHALVSSKKLWNGPFVLPLEGKTTSPYGRYRVYTTHIQRRIHWGIDFRAPIGTQVRASGAGKIVLAKTLYFSGKTVMIDHGHGLISVYAHMLNIVVKPGDVVKQKQVLGTSGKTGKATGPLLHWQVILNRVKVDPLDLLKLKVDQPQALVRSSK